MLRILGIFVLIPIVGLIIFIAFSVVYNKIIISQISTTKQYSYNLASKIDYQNKNDQDQVEAIISGEVVKTETVENWTTYVQPEDGYTFSYPKSWFLKVCSNGTYNGNLRLDPKPINDPCISDSPPKDPPPLVSLFARQGKSIDELIEEAKNDLPSIFFETTDKKSVIDNKEYRQIVLILKFIPAFFDGVPIPTKSVLTFVDFPEKNQVLIVGLNALDSESENADTYRQIISSIKKIN